MNAENSQNIEISETNFEAEVLRSKQPVVVLFTAPWSKACGVIKPILEEVATACPGKLKVLKVNVDDHLDLGIWYDIQYIPTLLYFDNGEERVRLVGTASKEAIISKIKPFLQAVSTSSPSDSPEPSRNGEDGSR